MALRGVKGQGPLPSETSAPQRKETRAFRESARIRRNSSPSRKESADGSPCVQAAKARRMQPKRPIVAPTERNKTQFSTRQPLFGAKSAVYPTKKTAKPRICAENLHF